VNDNIASTAANIQRAHATAIEKQENSFTRKLKENKEAFRRTQLLKNPQNATFIRGSSNGPASQSVMAASMGLKEFATPGCSDINDY
jgi:serine/threonine protein kinase